LAIDHLIEPLQFLPGIQRDGTPFHSRRYIDGQWCRFYLGEPKKIGGYDLIDPGSSEIIRNMYVINKQNSVDVYLGRPASLEFFNSTLQGITNAETSRTPVGFIADPNNTWTFDQYTNPAVSTIILLGNNPISTTINTNVVQVTVPDSSIFRAGQILTLSGAAATGGLTAPQINIQAPITIVDGTHYSFVAPATATSTAVGGGNEVTLSYLTTVALAVNPLTTMAASRVVTITVPDSSIFQNGQLVGLAGATTTDTITAATLNVVSPITIVDPTHISFVAGTAGLVGANGGGNAAILSYAATITYLLANAAPNADDINNEVQTNIYAGDINSNGALTLLDPVYLPRTSGGIVVVGPYLMMYGNDGVVSITLTPNNWATALNVPIAGTKIILGLRTRGGSNTPAVLFWAMDSLVRGTFQGGITPFSFDTIQDGISIMGQNCVVSIFNIYYWIGVDQFYIYNGVVRPLDNDQSRDYFFDNINMDQRNKVFGWVNERFNEIWWHWPKGNATECTDVLIFNYKDNAWYDSVLGRSAAFAPSFFPKPMLADSNPILNQFLPTVPVTVPLANNPLFTVNGSNVVIVTTVSTAGLFNGTIVTIAGAVDSGGLTAAQMNVTGPIIVTDATHFTYIAGANAGVGAGAAGGNAVTFTYNIPNLCYGVWQHEKGTDMVLYGQSLAIQSFYETPIKTMFERSPQGDMNLRARRIEPDFIQQQQMTLTINYRSFAQSIITSSPTYTFQPGQTIVELAKVDTFQMGRLVSFRFESNISDGYYQGGKVLLNYAPGDYRP